MTENFDYDDDQARSGVRQFGEISGQLGAMAGQVNAELSGDSPWSDDKLGASFASKFDPDRSQVIDNVKRFAAKVDSIAPALNDAIDKITRADNERPH